MKTKISILFALVFSLQPWAVLRAGTSIDLVNRYAYGANIGWLNGVADTNNGAVMGDYVCSGYIYSANVGWINLGSGSPMNGIQYQNLSATDFGVNNDGLGHLSGYAWSANCGWISLSNAEAYVQTDYLYPGPLAPDGLPIPWLLSYFGTTNVNANSDPTGKGMTIAGDYAAGTDPNNVNSVLRITAESVTAQGTLNSLTWNSEPT